MLCLIDLAHLTGGTLRFGPMPPLDGQWSAVGRIALDSRLVEPGDLFWRLPGLPGQTLCSPQHALFRGAGGVVAPEGLVQPWPGRFCLEVEDPLAALATLIDQLDESAAHANLAELKDLQLCRHRALDKTPPTCGRPASELDRSLCRRAA
jgi:UDP-N-acetylmuramyl pentapeptide synthase